MKIDSLQKMIRAGEIDTVIVGFPDVFGRLVGKRFVGRYFLDHVLNGGTHGCNYLLAVNIEMEPMDGFKLANWDDGFGDFEMRPDPLTIRLIPWLPSTALVICDYLKPNGQPVAEAPRSVLKRQVDRLTDRGWTCNIASELEFYLLNATYPEAFAAGYRNLTPSSDYRIDYHILQPGRDEGLFRAIRNGMIQAEVPVESSKGEWSRGQHEINFIYTTPIEMADRHVVFKQGVKEIAQAHGKSVTFMAKYAASEAGNSCHIHSSLWAHGENLFWDETTKKGSKLYRQFLGGLLKYSPELCYLFAPTINSYKRYQSGSWAPTKMAWAHDNRTVGFRVVGHGGSFRIENRMPGADANPYLAFAATIAAGLAGIDEGLDCGEEYMGNAYIDPKLLSLPKSLRDAVEALDRSAFCRKTLGDNVVDFYVHTGRLEVQAFGDAVTDWERVRYYERI